MKARFVVLWMTIASLPACVTINTVTPDPAKPGDTVWLNLSNVIGPMSVEPGPSVAFDGQEMSLDPDTAAVVGFEVPEGTPDGTYDIRVHDGIGVLEVITILPLLRRRSDTTTIEIDAQ